MTCPDPTPCIVPVIGPGGEVSFVPVASPDPESDFACGPGGTFATKNLQVVNCKVTQAFAADGVPASVSEAIALSDSLVLTNPTTDRVMHCSVNILFGATRVTMTPLGVGSVTDQYQFGIVGTLTPGGFITAGGSSFSDGNTTIPDIKSFADTPGRCVPFAVCPALGPGVSLEVQVRRLYTSGGLPGTLVDFLLQPTTINAWGIVV